MIRPESAAFIWSREASSPLPKVADRGAGLRERLRLEEVEMTKSFSLRVARIVLPQLDFESALDIPCRPTATRIA